MKQLKWLLSILMVLAVICFVGCSKDDDKNNGGIVGTWVTEGDPEEMKVIFNPGGTGTVYEEFYDGKWKYVHQFTWTYSNGIVIMTIDIGGYYQKMSFSYSGGNRVVIDEDWVMVRQ